LITEKPRPLPLSMAAHGPFILTIDRGRGLGYWQERQGNARYRIIYKIFINIWNRYGNISLPYHK
jgi:hypothetical protein